MPFEPAGGDGVVSTKNYKINTRKVDSNGGSVYKTPQIGTSSRQVDARPLSTMRSLMAE